MDRKEPKLHKFLINKPRTLHLTDEDVIELGSLFTQLANYLGSKKPGERETYVVNKVALQMDGIFHKAGLCASGEECELQSNFDKFKRNFAEEIAEEAEIEKEFAEDDDKFN